MYSAAKLQNISETGIVFAWENNPKLIDYQSQKSPAETIASAGPKVISALVGIGLYSNPKALVAPLKMSPL